MGIQINGNTNNINAGIGSLSIEDINELDIVGVATAANFKTGVSNLHNVGLTLSGGQIDVGSNIKIGTAGVVTATSLDISGDIDVDGHTNLDNVSIAGVTTFSTSPVVTNGRYYSGIINSGSQQKIIGGYISGSDTLRLGESMYLTSTGLGIKDTNPSYTLSVKDTGHVRTEIQSTDNNSAGIFLRVNNGGSDTGNSTIRVDSSGNLQFYTGTSSGTEKLYITSGGQVNIGGDYTQTSYNLSVTNTGGNLFRIKTANEGDYDLRFMVQNSESNIWHYGTDDFVFGNRYDRKLHFITNGSKRLTIHGTYVGINQTAPQTGLHINQDWVSSYGSISAEGSANALVGLGLRSNGNYRASLIWRDGSSGNYLDIATYGAAYPILFRPNGTEKVRITGGGDLEMTGGTVSLKEHMIRVGNRTTAQINAGVSTSTGSLTLDTSVNNLKVYVNNQWATVKKVGNDGSSQSLAARSAKALLDDGFTTSGVYWLDMHGGYTAGNAKLHYCLMDSSYDGGGWTMLYSMNHGNNFASGSNYSFSLNVGSPTSISDFTAGNWGYDRRNTFLPAANDQFLIRRSDNNDWKRFVVSNWSPTANSVSNGWETTNRTDGGNTGHPYWALGQMYDASGNSVSGHTHFNGCAKGGNCNSGGGDGSGFGNYSQWLDCVGNSGFGGGYNSQANGGSPLFWGQNNALSQGGSLYIQMFYRKAGTQ